MKVNGDVPAEVYQFANDVDAESIEARDGKADTFYRIEFPDGELFVNMRRVPDGYNAVVSTKAGESIDVFPQT